MARYTTSAENSCAWQAAGIRPRRNVAARFVALSFTLCSFVAELHQIGRPSPSELSGHAANRRRSFTTTCGTLYYGGVVTLSQSSTLRCCGVGCILRTARGSYFLFCSSLSTARIRSTVLSCRARKRSIRAPPEIEGSWRMRRVSCCRCSKIFFTAVCCASFRSRLLANTLTRLSMVGLWPRCATAGALAKRTWNT